MDLFLTVLTIVAPVFLLAAVGFVWVKAGYAYDTSFVTRLAMNIAVPALMFTAILDLNFDARVIGQIALASAVGYAVIGVLTVVLIWVLGLDRRVYLHGLTFGNTGNLGLPLALFAFGETGLGIAVIVFTVMVLYAFTFGVWAVSDRMAFADILKEPIAWGSALGVLFLVMGWRLPVFAMNTLELAGQMAIPLMLITLGVALARIVPGDIWRSLWLSVAKLILCFGVGLGAGRAFGLDGIELAVLVTQLATPVAVTSYLLTAKYGQDDGPVAGLVVVSTFLSVLALPVILALFIGA